jgi:hypothetical protein
MFAKGSRYRNLTQSSPVSGSGERLRGTDLRLIATTPGQFLHTVHDRDRLDLLAYKYYADPTRWWQICDANPQFAFPNDLIAGAPLQEITFGLVHPDAATRYGALLSALAGLGTVVAAGTGAPGDLVSSAILVEYAAAGTRAQIVAQFAAYGFDLLASFASSTASGLAEQFTIEDPVVKLAWSTMVRSLERIPGIGGVSSDLGNSAVSLTFNTEVAAMAGIRTVVAQHGFDIPPASVASSERVGAQIVIPPNGVG